MRKINHCPHSNTYPDASPLSFDTIVQQVIQPIKPQPGSSPWRWQSLLLAPHRLGFFLAMGVLAASGLWWAAVQFDRAGAGLGLHYAVSPSMVHSTVMVFGFLPLFFCGFLFTAGPKWLSVHAPSAREVMPPLLWMAAGWMLWLAAAHVHEGLALAALGCALGGLSAVAWRFWRMVRASPAADRLHAKVIAGALLAGCASLAGAGVALLSGADDIARAAVLTGLWSFIVPVYAAVAHRMIPFFTSSALPMVRDWRPFWVLWLMLGVAGFETMAVWAELAGAAGPAWLLLRGALEAAAGAALVWLVFALGLVQSLKLRLASLHAVTMGCLGSLMLAMVTRVSCGHSGRPLVADDLVWTLFLLLQATVLLRLAAAASIGPVQTLLAAASLLWAGVMLAWALRYGSWYGREF